MLLALQVLKSVLSVADSFSNKEMCTFSCISAYQSTSEAFNTSLCRGKTKPASVNYFAILVHGDEYDLWYISVTSFCLFCVVEHHILKMTFHHNIKKNVFHISTNIPTFFSSIVAGQSTQRPVLLPQVKVSAI